MSVYDDACFADSFVDLSIYVLHAQHTVTYRALASFIEIEAMAGSPVQARLQCACDAQWA